MYFSESPTQHDRIHVQLSKRLLCFKPFTAHTTFLQSLRLFLKCCRLRRFPASTLASQCTWEPSRNSDLNGKECTVVSSPSLAFKLRQYVLLLLLLLSLTYDWEWKRREWNTNHSSHLTFPHLSFFLSIPFSFFLEQMWCVATHDAVPCKRKQISCWHTFTLLSYMLVIWSMCQTFSL